jgi:hypothetical protein
VEQVLLVAQVTAKPEFPVALSMAMLVTLAPAILAVRASVWQAALQRASRVLDQTRKMARPALPADCRRPTPADRH